MADETESPSGKKHRVIHWNPDAGRETAQRRWTWKRVVLWSVGGFFGLLFAVGIVNRAARHLFKVEIFGTPAVAAATGAAPADPNSAFVSQSKAELAFEQASKSLATVQRMPQDHPQLLQQLIQLQKNLQDGQRLLAAHDWSLAFQTLSALNRDIDTYGRNIKTKQEAMQQKGGILVRIKDLEIARSLAPGALESALESASQGSKLLEEGNFLAAKEVFDKGYAELDRAKQALTKGQRATATEAFKAALEKAPGNEVAIKGLKRAETIDRVFALLLQGESFEKQAQYAQAAEAYQKAFSLDGQSAAAQAGVARANRLEKETKFEAAFSAAQAAIKRRDWSKAIAEAQNALRIDPKKTEVQAMLKSARENEHRDAVQKSLNKAYAFENEHQWVEAHDAYLATLKLEPNHADAIDGSSRTNAVIRALLAYKTYLEAAKQLADRAEFQAAIRRFNDAMSAKPSYLVPDEATERLHAMLMTQNKPVDVTFKSDGKTWVSITNYRAPAQFETATFKILPGNYEVRGMRKGFQDVLMTLQVRGGSQLPVVNVVCQYASDRS
jgi:tetratricopeptide (TPR) repeat protein